MKQKELLRRVWDMAQPICAEAGVSLWDVTFEKEGRGYVLTVFIDREEGVGIAHCETVSRALSPLLDAPEFDSLPPYTLCVSSPGLTRRLRLEAHFAWAVGKPVELTFFQGEAQRGVLAAFSEESLTLEPARVYPRAEIAGAHIDFEF